MIHAGTSRTGSGRTLGVTGSYWMSSMRRLRKTTLPCVAARSLPTFSTSSPASGLPSRSLPASSSQSAAPSRSVWPPLRAAAASTSGFAHGWLLGDIAPRLSRPRCSTRRRSCSARPGKGAHPVRQRRSRRSCVWARAEKGGASHPAPANRLSSRSGWNAHWPRAAGAVAMAAAPRASAAPSSPRRSGCRQTCCAQLEKAAIVGAGSTPPVAQASACRSASGQVGD